MTITASIAIIAILLSILTAVSAWACAAVGGDSEREAEEKQYGLRGD